MRKIRQILAIIGLILIAFFFIRFFIKAASGTSSTADLMLALAAAIVIPVVLYIMQRLAEGLGNKDDSKKQH